MTPGLRKCVMCGLGWRILCYGWCYGEPYRLGDLFAPSAPAAPADEEAPPVDEEAPPAYEDVVADDVAPPADVPIIVVEDADEDSDNSSESTEGEVAGEVVVGAAAQPEAAAAESVPGGSRALSSAALVGVAGVVDLMAHRAAASFKSFN